MQKAAIKKIGYPFKTASIHPLLNTIIMIKKLSILVFSLVAFFSSCTNDEQGLSRQSTTELLAAQDPQLAANPNNPYDYFGKAHYDGLLFVSKKTNGFTKSKKKQEAALAEFIKSQSFADTRSSSPSSLTDEELIQVLEQAQEAKIRIDTIHTSAAMINAVTLYTNTLQRLSDIEGYPEYSAIKDSIMLFENVIIQDMNLTEIEKERLLKSTSTFRYSALQWEKYIKEHDTKLTTRGKRKWYHWIVIVGADAIGAFVDGSVTGAVLASKTASDEISKGLSKIEEEKQEEMSETDE